MSFNILYAAAGGNSSSSGLDFHILMSLAETGNRVSVLLQNPLKASDRVALERLMSVHFISSNPKLRDDMGSFAWQTALEFASGAYDWVIARGLAFSRTLAGNEAMAQKLWPVLPDIELRPHLDLGSSGKNYLDTVVERSSGVLVQGDDMRVAIGETNVRFAAKIFAVRYTKESDRDSYSTSGRIISSVLKLASAPRRVLVYRLPVSTLRDCLNVEPDYLNMQDGSLNHIVWVTGSDQQDGAQSENCTKIKLDASFARDSAKVRAWRLGLVMTALKCDIFICGDSEVAYYLQKNKPLAHHVWPYLSSDDVQGSDDIGAVGGMAAKSASTVLVESNYERSILESHLPAVSGRVVVSGVDGNGIAAAIARRCSDYAKYPCRTTTRKVLFASHDFKFCGEIISAAQQRKDIDLRFDFWKTQNSFDGPIRESSIGWADVVFCDFASPNIGWYIRNKRPGQKLVVRMHGYELHGSWLSDLDLESVDRFVFVSEVLLRSAMAKFDIPYAKTLMIPNMVDLVDLRRPKLAGSRFHLGIVGIVPILKRPDRVLDLLELLSDVDSRYTVHIKGQQPWQYTWVWNDKDVRDSYGAFYERLATNPRLRNRVGFDGFSPAMGQWFQKIGWVLSPSKRESFHLGPVEGMASGSVPVVWDRAGASGVFDRRWLHQTTEDVARFILRSNENEESYDRESSLSLEHVRKFDSHKIGIEWIQLLLDV